MQLGLSSELLFFWTMWRKRVAQGGETRQERRSSEGENWEARLRAAQRLRRGSPAAAFRLSSGDVGDIGA